jgi:hypothetical protein
MIRVKGTREHIGCLPECPVLDRGKITRWDNDKRHLHQFIEQL